jgi:serine/threonine-protein kinase
MTDTYPSPGATPPRPGPPDLSGQTFGEFFILRRIGQGGMGQVFLAEQLSLKRKVALKFLRPDLAANPTALLRFRTEAEAMARVSHPHIVQVYAVGERDGLHFMALEYVEGRNLKDQIRLKGSPKLEVALAIMRQVALALQRAGELGIVHRDVKPENILLNRQGPLQVKVADFGLSRLNAPAGDNPALNLTQSGVTMGTPLYMSPEQVRGEPVDHRSDIYSFGVTCYHMLSGEPPYRGQSAFEVALQHVQGTPPPLAGLRPDLPPELTALVHRMMSKDPAERPQTGREVVVALATLRSGRPDVTASDVLPPEAVLPPAPRAVSAWVRYALVGLAVVAAAGGGAVLRRFVQPTPGLTGAAVAAEKPVPPVSRDERLMLEEVERFAAPNADQLRKGVAHHIELGVYYLDRHRLDDAERFFTGLSANPKVPAYQALGQLGQAIVLSLRDQADASLEKFKAVFTDREERWKQLFRPPFGGSPEMADLRAWLVRALERDESRKSLPPELKGMLRQFKNRPGAGPKA